MKNEQNSVGSARQWSIGLLVLALMTGLVFLRAHPAQGQSSQYMKLAATPPGHETATFAGGCFWAMQAMFSRLKGVDDAQPGYVGGQAVRPSYEDVCTESTGHAETINISFDPKVISYKTLVDVYFHSIDPTTPDQQGDDVGSSYRSVIFYRSAAQKAIVEAEISQINAEKVWSNPIVTQVVPFTTFYPAEVYHNNYFALNPYTGYCVAVVAPKVAKFKAHYAALLK